MSSPGAAAAFALGRPAVPGNPDLTAQKRTGKITCPLLRVLSAHMSMASARLSTASFTRLAAIWAARLICR